MAFGDIVAAYRHSKKDIENVILQLEGKHFCEETTLSNHEHFTIRLYLTNKCNLRCTHCFMFAENGLDNELSIDEIKELLMFFVRKGCNKVIYTGGEVGVRNDFVELIEFSKKLGLYVQVLSNGTTWNNAEINELANYIDAIQISIDGFDENSNAKIRGKGNFEKALNTVAEFLKTSKVFVTVSVTPLYDMLESYYREYIEFGRYLLKKHGHANFSVIFNGTLLNGRDVVADSEKNKAMSSKAEFIMNQIYPNNELVTFIKSHEYNQVYNSCGYGTLNINSNGNFYFCSRLNDVQCYGNIREKDFEEIIELRRKIWISAQVDNVNPCRECGIRYICGGECRVENFKNIAKYKVDDLDCSNMLTRSCSNQKKNELYKLMIQSNEYLLW